MNTSATRPPEKLPDPWLFDSESLMRELDRCRELVLQISIAHPHQTHFDINIAVNALWNLRENLRYLLALYREGQRAFAKHAEVKPAKRNNCEAKSENRWYQGITNHQANPGPSLRSGGHRVGFARH